jgi:hypothetical protein
MFSIISLLVVIVLSMLVVRIATVALSLTGLSNELARFQARSAFTGAGFTTDESEKVVAHPVRRRIIMLLMLLGNAGIVTAVSSLIISFVGAEQSDNLTTSLWFRITALLAGLAILWQLAYSRWIDRHLSRLIAWTLGRYTTLEARDYANLLHLSGDYAVIELQVTENDWLADQSLRELRLNDEGVLVLGIEKNGGSFVGAPRGHTVLAAGDTVICYGPSDTLRNLDDRRRGTTGNWEHHKAVDKQKQVAASENRDVDSPGA